MLAAIVCTIACMAQPATPAHHYDFRKWFRTLAQNRVEYNRYNDSIFQIRDHDHWTRFLQVRARKNHEINLSNRLIIDSINHAVTVGEVFWAFIVAVAVLQATVVEGGESRVALDVRFP